MTITLRSSRRETPHDLACSPPRLDLVAADRIDLDDLAVLRVDHQQMPVGRPSHGKRTLQEAIFGDCSAKACAVVARASSR